MTTVYLIRHAAYESPGHILPGRLPGFPLSAGGREQAARMAWYFQKKSITAIYASPLLRTRQTAEIIAKTLDLPLGTDERLLEVRSAFGGKKEGFVESMGGWLYTTQWHRENGGETPEEIVTRMDTVVREKVSRHPGKEIIIVSHGDPIVLLMTSYLKHPLTQKGVSETPYVQMGNGFVLAFDHGRFLASKGLALRS